MIMCKTGQGSKRTALKVRKADGSKTAANAEVDKVKGKKAGESVDVEAKKGEEIGRAHV